jgi:hypothetical protein
VERGELKRRFMGEGIKGVQREGMHTSRGHLDTCSEMSKLTLSYLSTKALI